jgi:D-psicose/D-tagatose/L-ribulose 3-epimerase
VSGLYDTFHTNIEESHPVAALLESAHVVRHVHISESHRGVPGTGHVNWPATFHALKQINYDGWLTVEVFGRAVPAFAAAARVWRDLPEGRSEVCRRSYEHVRQGWDSAL